MPGLLRAVVVMRNGATCAAPGARWRCVWCRVVLAAERKRAVHSNGELAGSGGYSRVFVSKKLASSLQGCTATVFGFWYMHMFETGDSELMT